MVFKWLLYFFIFYVAKEYYIGHVVSTVLPLVGKITWNLFSWLEPLIHLLGFANPIVDNMLVGFVDFYHKTLLNLNNILEILLLCVVCLAKTWLNVRVFIYGFLAENYAGGFNPHYNPVVRMLYERVELWIDNIQWPMIAYQDTSGPFTKKHKGFKVKLGSRYYMVVKSGKAVFNLDSRWPIPLDIQKDGRKWHGIIRGRINNQVKGNLIRSFLKLIIIQILNAINYPIEKSGLLGGCQ